MLAKIKLLLSKPKPQRNAGIRSALQKMMGRVRFGFLGALVNRPGSMFVLNYRPDSDYVFQSVADAALFRRYWIHGNSANNLGDTLRLYALLLNVAQIKKEGIVGEFAELGVYKGNSARVLCHFAEEEKRRVFLFDTFSGFDERDLKGVDHSTNKHFRDTSLEGVKAFVDSSQAVFVPGRFPESITPEATAAKYALVHIDCDLYEPAKAALEFFYPRMVPGGILIMHDYSSRYWDGMRQAVDEFLPSIPERIVLWADKSGTAVLRKSMSIA